MHLIHFTLAIILIYNSIATTKNVKQDYRKYFKQTRNQRVLNFANGRHGSSSGVNSLEPIFTQCCTLGTTWAEEKKDCDVTVSPPVPGIPVDLQTPCLVTASICCLKHARVTMCDLGKVDAMDGNECLRSVLPGGEYRKDCCDSCKIGLMTGSRGEQCSFTNFAFDYPWDEGFADCCQISKLSGHLPEIENEVGTGLCKISNPCQHICKDTGSSIECSCNPGYQLGHDFKSCEDIDECLTGFHLCDAESQQCVNTVGSYFCLNQDGSQDHPRTRTHFRSLEADRTTFSPANVPKPIDPSVGLCPVGYEYSPTTRTCNDIDECSLRLDTCNRHTHNCQNIQGSFLCIERPSPECSPGFKYNTALSQCFDINECAEGLDYCSRERELCINTNGGYECQPKTRSQCPAGYKYNTVLLTCEDVNECHENLHNCDLVKELCRNTIGGYECDLRCEKGFRYNLSVRQCLDVDECAEGTDNCDKTTQNCVNSAGSFACVSRQPDCPLGYQYDPRQRTCIDVDECQANLHNCPQNNICINTAGSYQCQPHSTQQCDPGYRVNPTTGQCVDIDECHEALYSCPTDEECRNELGSFSCVAPKKKPPCDKGYHYNPRTDSCVDVDECLERLHDCRPGEENCINIEGSFTCKKRRPRRPGRQRHRQKHGQQAQNRPQNDVRTCDVGFEYNETMAMCIDINECQTGVHNCIESQRCDNTIGSFTCIRTTGCGTGYTLNAHTGQCEDDDECELGLHDCGLLYDCRNTLGSFRCLRKSCSPGFRLETNGKCVAITCNAGFKIDSSGQCVDINECDEINSCTVAQICANTIGSYKCEQKTFCGEGFELDFSGIRCIDIDECKRSTHTCRGGQNCINRPGGFACQCPLGYIMNNLRDCEDIDECLQYSHICSENGQCVNTPGSYVCRCKSGFQQSEDGKTCIDVDECKQSFICHHKCINTWGSYQCTCNQGFTLGADARSCEDIDECSLWRGRGHLCIGICINEPGSYKCSCPDGYKLESDKRTCHDINECSQPNICRGENEVCLNTRGGYRCNAVVCPPNFVKDQEHKNRCKRESLICQQNDPECLRTPMSISYNYITFVSNLRIPPSGHLDLFTMRGPLWTSTTVQFTLELASARAPAGVVGATRTDFDLRRTSYNQAVISMVKSIEGPQDIELELIMKIYSNGLYGGQAVAKIFIFVSQYDF